MAELDLTPIENGMPDGGTAVGKNFTDIVAALQPLVDAEAVKYTSLWTGANRMGDGATITPSLPLSKCPTGWLVCFAMTSGTTDRNWCFVPKNYGTTMAGKAINFSICTSTGGHRTQKSIVCTDTTINGVQANMATDATSGKPGDFSMTDVVAI